jgi:hypothetical protein
VFHTTKCGGITLTALLFTPLFQMAESRKVVVELAFEQLTIDTSNKASINGFFGYINSKYPSVGLNLIWLFHNFWLSNTKSELWIETFIIGLQA